MGDSVISGCVEHVCFSVQSHDCLIHPYDGEKYGEQ